MFKKAGSQGWGVIPYGKNREAACYSLTREKGRVKGKGRLYGWFGGGEITV